jgi:hypothetical protein
MGKPDYRCRHSWWSELGIARQFGGVLKHHKAGNDHLREFPMDKDATARRPRID